MSKIAELIKVNMSQMSLSQREVCRGAGIEPSSFSRYLGGDTDLRSSSFVKVLNKIGIDLEVLLLDKASHLLGLPSQTKPSLGQDIEVLLEKESLFVVRGYLRSLIAMKAGRDLSLCEMNAIERLKHYVDRIPTIQRSFADEA